MDTRLRDNAAPALFDQEIVGIIDRARDEHAEGRPMKFGIRNEAGAIYRSIRTTGPHELIRFTDAMESAGFTDELADDMRMRDGFDGIFRRL